MDLFRLASAQHAAVSVRQLRELGLTHDAIQHLVESGQWRRASPGVLVRRGAPATDGQDLMIAVLDAGTTAGASHYSGGAWFAVPGNRLRPLHVSRLRNSTSTPSRFAIIHEPRSLPTHHLTVHRGVTVTVPSRIPFDLASLGDAPGAERFLDRAWARHLLNFASTTRMLEELAGRGRKGITLMRELLEERGANYRPNDTGLEDRVQELARAVGLRLERQRNLCDRGEWLGRVDLVDESKKVVIEADSALYHEALIDRRADAARQAELEAAGYRVHRITDHEAFHEREATIRVLRAIRSGS